MILQIVISEKQRRDSMNEIPLIVPTLNRFDLFVNMMQTVDYPIRPYIINNSKNGNIGVAASWNEGISRALNDGYEYAIIANDDIEFLPNTIQCLVNDIQAIDAITISTNSILIGRDIDFFFKRDGFMSGSSYSCFIMNIKRAVEEIGLFDQNFHPAYYEDTDMKYRIALAGSNEYVDTEIGIIHHGSATGAAVVSNDRWNELREYYKSKWGGYPLEEIWTHPYNDESKSIKYWHGMPNDE